MLTFSKKPMTSAQAIEYYLKENYYQKNSELGHFHGKGLEHLGLVDGKALNKEDFKSLLLGFHPETGEKLVKNAGDPDRRAGMDATFSAPKSMSILDALARVHGNEELSVAIREAQDRAVQIAMQKMQDNYAWTRIADPDRPGETIRVKTDGLSWVTITHDTGRETLKGEIDPQIHSHNFILNVVTYTDPTTGETKTLTLSNEEMLANKMYLGQFYRNELAAQLNELGFTTVLTDARQGFFELANSDGSLMFDKNQLKMFSGRSEEIKAVVAEFEKKYPGVDDAKLKDIINQAIKTSKKTLDEEEFIEEFIARSYRSGIDDKRLESIINDMVPYTQRIVDPQLLQDQINKALSYVTEKESVFSKEDMMKELLKYGLEYGIVESEYQAALVENPNYIQLDDNQFTSQEILDMEKEIIVSVLSSKDQFKPIALSVAAVRAFCQEKFKTMNDQQLDFVETVLHSTDQFIAVQGKAGTGKTFSAKAIKDYLDEHHPEIEIFGASFMGKAADGLEQDSGIKSSTLDAYFNQEAKEASGPRNKQRILLVDEAGMTGVKHLHKLLSIAKEKGDKVIFIGDSDQFPSISAGRVFKDMQDYGITTVYLTDSIRQKTAHTKEAVESITQKDVVKALEIVKNNGNLHEIETLEDRMQFVIDDYLTMDQKNRDNTIVLAATNKERRYGNAEFRKALGIVDDTLYETREMLTMNGIEKYYSMSYEEVDYISINEAGNGFKKGEIVEFAGIADRNSIYVKNKHGNIHELNLMQMGNSINVYKSVEKGFAPGDKITFTKNSQSGGLRVKNGTLDIIDSIDGEGNVVTKEGRKFNLNQMPYLDHAYVITNMKSQGMTADNVYVMAHSRLANLQAFYVEASRTKFQLTVLTDNVEDLIKNASKEKIKTSTLDYQSVRNEVMAEVIKRSEYLSPEEKQAQLNLINNENFKKLKIGVENVTEQQRRIALREPDHQSDGRSNGSTTDDLPLLSESQLVSDITTTELLLQDNEHHNLQREGTHDHNGLRYTTARNDQINGRGAINESGRTATHQTDSEESIRHDQPSNRNGERDRRDLSDISGAIRASLSRIAANEHFGNYSAQARQTARAIKGFDMAMEINTIKRDLPPQILFDKLNLDKDQYLVYKDEKDYYKIQHEGRAYNTSDFLTKHLKQTWPEAQATLEGAYSDYVKDKIMSRSIEKSEFKLAEESELTAAKAQAKEFKSIIEEAKKRSFEEFLSDDWQKDKSRSTEYYGAFRNMESGEKIIFSKGKDEKYRYFNPSDENDRGTIVDFMQNRGITELKAQAEYVQNIRRTNVKDYKPARTAHNVDMLRDKFMRMDRIDGYNQYLSEERGIDQRIYNEYSRNIRVDNRGNIVSSMFQHEDDQKFVFSGYNAKLTSDFAPQGERIKDLTYGNRSISALLPQDKQYDNVVIAESTIDGMSYIQLQELDPKKTMIVSLNGQSTESSRMLAGELAEGKNVVIAVDNDAAGQRYVEMLRKQKQLENAKVDLPTKNKDWNEELKAKVHEEQHQMIQEAERAKEAATQRTR